MLKKILCVSFLIIGIQYLVYQIMDPLSFSDTTRYFKLADFFKAPGVTHSGDLAYNNGLLYTSLFLPGSLFLSNKFLHLSYVFSGGVLQVISFLAILILSFGIAFRLAGERTAWLTLMLLLTHAIYCLESVRIATEYPYTAIFLGMVYLASIHNTLGTKQAWLLSLLSAGLISLRTQGLILIMLLALYLVLSRRMQPRSLMILFFLPLVYLIFYFLFFVHLDSKYPMTLMLNETFTLRSFLSDPYGLCYNFAAHGLKPAGIVLKSIQEDLHLSLSYAGVMAVIYNNAFLLALLIAAAYSKLRQKRLLLTLIFGHGLVTLAGLTPYYALARYQAAVFPLCMILLADHFMQGFQDWRRMKYRLSQATVFFLCSLLLYGTYAVMRHVDYFQTLTNRSGTILVFSREAAETHAAFIRDKIGTGQKIVAANVSHYGIITRSGNIALYGGFSWGKKELTDYLTRHGTKFLLCDGQTLMFFKATEMPITTVYRFPPALLRSDETLLLVVFKDQ